MKTRFNFIGVQPPSNLFVSPGQALCIVADNNGPLVQISIQAAYVTPDGNDHLLRRVFPVAAYNGNALLVIPLTECYLLSVTAQVDNPPLGANQCYVRIRLESSTAASRQLVQTLAAGYIGSGTELSFPQSGIVAPLDAFPSFENQDPADPAAGDQCDYQILPRTVCTPYLVSVHFVTSVAAANRYVYVGMNVGGPDLPFSISNIAMPAGTTRDIVFGINSIDFDSVLVKTVPLASNMWLQPGNHLIVGAANMQAADQFGSCFILFRKLISI